MTARHGTSHSRRGSPHNRPGRGGGGGLSAFTSDTTENPYESYDDTWIRDWMGDASTYNQHRFNETERNLRSIEDLQSWNQDRFSEIQNLQTWNEDRARDIRGLTTRTDANTDHLDLLQSRLDNWDTTTEVGDVQGLDEILSGLQSDYQSDIQDVERQLGDYLKTGDFRQRMYENLDSLGQTLRGEFGRQIGTLDLESIRRSIADQGGDLSRLTSDFAGLSSDLSSDIQSMAGDLRQDFGDQVLNLSDTFGDRLGDVQTALGGDISQLFKESGSLQTGLDTLTSGLGTTTQQLEALRDSFGDYKTDAATNLGNVKEAFANQIGEQGTDFTEQLGNLESSTAQDLLGLREDVESDRAKAISDLDTTWSGRLQDQDQRLQEQYQQGADDLNRRLSDISSSMNYRTLGDSAQGVKIRRSRAYNTGRTRTGTGQLGRSMKISTLNI